MRIFVRNKKEPRTSYQSVFVLANVFKSFLSLVIDRLTILDALIQRGLIAVLQKLQLVI